MMLVMVPAVTVDTKALSELDLLVTKVQGHCRTLDVAILEPLFF